MRACVCVSVCACASPSQQDTAAELSAVQPSDAGCTKLQSKVLAPLEFSKPVQVRLEMMAGSVGGSMLNGWESEDQRQNSVSMAGSHSRLQ